MIERGQQVHQALDREARQLVVTKRPDLGLRDAQHLGGISLRGPAFFERLIQRIRQPQLGLAFSGIGKPEVGEHISGATADQFSPLSVAARHNVLLIIPVLGWSGKSTLFISSKGAACRDIVKGDRAQLKRHKWLDISGRDGVGKRTGRPVRRQLRQCPTRPTLAEEHGVIQRVEAVYVGGVLKPARELPLQDQQRVRLTVETIDEPESDREAAVVRLKAGIASMRFFSEVPLPSREERHDRD